MKKSRKNKSPDEKCKNTKNKRFVLYVIAFVIIYIVTLFFSEELGGVFNITLHFAVILGFWALIAFLVNIGQSKIPKLPKKVEKRLEEENKTDGPANWKL